MNDSRETVILGLRHDEGAAVVDALVTLSVGGAWTAREVVNRRLLLDVATRLEKLLERPREEGARS